MRLLGRATAAAARSVKVPSYHGWTRTSLSSCSGVRDAEDRLRAVHHTPTGNDIRGVDGARRQLASLNARGRRISRHEEAGAEPRLRAGRLRARLRRAAFHYFPAGFRSVGCSVDVVERSSWPATMRSKLGADARVEGPPQARLPMAGSARRRGGLAAADSAVGAARENGTGGADVPATDVPAVGAAPHGPRSRPTVRDHVPRSEITSHGPRSRRGHPAPAS